MQAFDVHIGIICMALNRYSYCYISIIWFHDFCVNPYYDVSVKSPNAIVLAQVSILDLLTPNTFYSYLTILSVNNRLFLHQYTIRSYKQKAHAKNISCSPNILCMYLHLCFYTIESFLTDPDNIQLFFLFCFRFYHAISPFLSQPVSPSIFFHALLQVSSILLLGLVF